MKLAVLMDPIEHIKIGKDSTFAMLLEAQRRGYVLYYLLQRLYRQSVPADASQQEQRTTTQTILNVFTSYTLLIHQTRVGREVQPTQLTSLQREVLQRLRFPPPAQILSKRLARPPT